MSNTEIVSRTSQYVVGVDIGGTTTTIGLVDRDGHILQTEQLATNSYQHAETYIQDLSNVIHRVIDANVDRTAIRGIGIGAPNANYFTGKIHKASNLPWLNGIPLSVATRKLTDIPVVLNNDANAATIGEMIYGAARGMKDFILITLGTGVGSGIVSNGELVYGKEALAGELGHVIVRPGGRPCACGRRGCLEAYVSASAVAMSAREYLQSSRYKEKSLLSLQQTSQLTAKDVYEAAMKGDELGNRVFEEAGTILGEALANFVAYSNPEAIILFGGLTKAGELLFAPMRKAMQDNLLHIYEDGVQLLCSSLPENEAAILGAAAMGWQAQ